MTEEYKIGDRVKFNRAKCNRCRSRACDLNKVHILVESLRYDDYEKTEVYGVTLDEDRRHGWCWFPVSWICKKDIRYGIAKFMENINNVKS